MCQTHGVVDCLSTEEEINEAPLEEERDLCGKGGRLCQQNSMRNINNNNKANTMVFCVPHTNLQAGELYDVLPREGEWTTRLYLLQEEKEVKKKTTTVPPSPKSSPHSPSQHHHRWKKSASYHGPFLSPGDRVLVLQRIDNVVAPPSLLNSLFPEIGAYDLNYVAYEVMKVGDKERTEEERRYNGCPNDARGWVVFHAPPPPPSPSSPSFLEEEGEQPSSSSSLFLLFSQVVVVEEEEEEEGDGDPGR